MVQTRQVRWELDLFFSVFPSASYLFRLVTDRLLVCLFVCLRRLCAVRCRCTPFFFSFCFAQGTRSACTESDNKKVIGVEEVEEEKKRKERKEETKDKDHIAKFLGSICVQPVVFGVAMATQPLHLNPFC